MRVRHRQGDALLSGVLHGTLARLRMTSSNHPLRVAPYAAITAIGMLAIDLTLPALPSMRLELGVPLELSQATMSAFLVSLAVSQLAWGEACDRFGPSRALDARPHHALALGAPIGFVTSAPELLALHFHRGPSTFATLQAFAVIAFAICASNAARVATNLGRTRAARIGALAGSCSPCKASRPPSRKRARRLYEHDLCS